MEIWAILVMLAVAVVALELLSVLRRGIGNQLGYFLLLSIDAALLGGTVLEPRFSSERVGPWPELVAGVLLCGLLVVVPALVDRALRIALAADRLDWAARMAMFKELLQPGRVASLERERLVELLRVRSGQVGQVVRELRMKLGEAEQEEEERHYHERIVAALALGERYREAATHFETHFRGDPAEHQGLAVQMVRVYSELDDLAHAAHIVYRIEQATRVRGGELLVAQLQARLFLAAFAAGSETLERLLGLRELAALSPATRALLRAIAARPERQALPEEVTRFARAAAERAESELHTVSSVPHSRPYVTGSLVISNVLCFLAFSYLLGGFDSGYDLLRAGANFHAGVRAGEWWRLWSALFLHGGENVRQGLIHLGLNMYGLYLLGRILEPLYGPARLLLIYAVAGLGGNLFSVFNPQPETILSLGASGAVMGLMGALMMSLLGRRGLWPEASRRTLVVNLAVLLVAQLGVGLFLKLVDNFAHIGGLLGGALVGLLVLPSGWLGRGRISQTVVIVLLGLLGASALASGLSLARERVDVTIDRLPRHAERIARIQLTVPDYTIRTTPTSPDWPGHEAIEDPLAGLAFAPHLLPIEGGGLKAALQACRDRDRATAEKQTQNAHLPPPKFDEVAVPTVSGWSGLGQRMTIPPMGPNGEAPLREDLFYFGRTVGEEALVVEVNYTGPWPNGTLGKLVARELERVLASIRILPPPPIDSK